MASFSHVPRRMLLIGLALCVAGWTGGCQVRPTAKPLPSGGERLVVGMRLERVQALLGEPSAVTPGTGDNYVQETWTYQITRPPVYRTIVAEMQEVPWVDPITGEMKTVQEPINDQQRLDQQETLTLVFRYGQLITIDRQLTEHRSFSR